jgi:hypothetical protein
MLAAYADGELDDRPGAARLRHQIKDWLADHPEVAAELDAQLELARLMAVTAPVEPSAATWRQVWDRVGQAPARRRRWTAAGWLAGLMAVSSVAAALVIALLQMLGSPTLAPVRDAGQPSPNAGQAVAVTPPPARPVIGENPRPNPMNVLAVMTTDEVDIIRIAGADTETVVAGRLPMAGSMVLLEHHEVEVMPPANGTTRTEIRVGGSGSSPMAWTPLPGDPDEDYEEV